MCRDKLRWCRAQYPSFRRSNCINNSCRLALQSEIAKSGRRFLIYSDAVGEWKWKIQFHGGERNYAALVIQRMGLPLMYVAFWLLIIYCVGNKVAINSSPATRIVWRETNQRRLKYFDFYVKENKFINSVNIFAGTICMFNMIDVNGSYTSTVKFNVHQSKMFRKLFTAVT